MKLSFLRAMVRRERKKRSRKTPGEPLLVPESTKPRAARAPLALTSHWFVLSSSPPGYRLPAEPPPPPLSRRNHSLPQLPQPPGTTSTFRVRTRTEMPLTVGDTVGTWSVLNFHFILPPPRPLLRLLFGGVAAWQASSDASRMRLRRTRRAVGAASRSFVVRSFLIVLAAPDMAEVTRTRRELPPNSSAKSPHEFPRTVRARDTRKREGSSSGLVGSLVAGDYGEGCRVWFCFCFLASPTRQTGAGARQLCVERGSRVPRPPLGSSALPARDVWFPRWLSRTAATASGVMKTTNASGNEACACRSFGLFVCLFVVFLCISVNA